MRCITPALRAMVRTAFIVTLSVSSAAPAIAAERDANNENKASVVVDATQLPQCPFVTRVIAIVSTGHDDTLAVLRVPGADASSWQTLVRVGDSYGGARVGHIGHQRVWLRSRAGWCQILRTLPVDASTASPVPGTKPPSGRKAPARSSLPDQIRNSIRQLQDNQYEVDRAVVDGIMDKHGSLLRGVQVIPKMQGGKPVAMTLRGVREGTLLDAFGIRSNDELHSINGFNIADPESALQAYARLRTAEHLTLAVVRGGKPLSIDVDIR